MELLLLMTYAAICLAVFRVFRIPLTKWTVPTAVLGGAVLIAALVLTMNYNHPFTRKVKQIYVVTPLVSQVRGRVTNVLVEPNVIVPRGYPLFELEDIPFRARVEELEAQLANTSQEVAGLVDTVTEARAQLARAEANRDQVAQSLQRYLAAPEAFSRQRIDVERERYSAARSEVDAATAALKRAEEQLSGSVDGEDPAIAAIQAQLKDARFDLENAVIRAPAQGYVTQLAVEPGVMAVPLPLVPLANFVHLQSGRLVAAFRQASLLRIEEGFEAELAFSSLPGKVFGARVKKVLPVIAEGQFQPGGQLAGGWAFAEMDGAAMVELELDDPSVLATLPLGMSAQAAVYSEHFGNLSLLRKILLRMLSWQHYLFLDH